MGRAPSEASPWTYACRIREEKELREIRVDLPLGFVLACKEALILVHGTWKVSEPIVEDVLDPLQVEKEYVDLRLGKGWKKACEDSGLSVGSFVLFWTSGVGKLEFWSKDVPQPDWFCGLRRRNEAMPTRSKADWIHGEGLVLPFEMSVELSKSEESIDERIVYLMDPKSGKEVLAVAAVIRQTDGGARDEKWRLQGEGWEKFCQEFLHSQSCVLDLELWPQSFGRCPRIAVKVPHRQMGLGVNKQNEIESGNCAMQISPSSCAAKQGENTLLSAPEILLQEVDETLKSKDESKGIGIDGSAKDNKEDWILLKSFWEGYMPKEMYMDNGMIHCSACGLKGLSVLSAMQHGAYCGETDHNRGQGDNIFSKNKRGESLSKNGIVRSSTHGRAGQTLQGRGRISKESLMSLNTLFGRMHCRVCGSRTLRKKSCQSHLSRCLKRAQNNWETQQMGWRRCLSSRFCGKEQGHAGPCNTTAEAIELALQKEHLAIAENAQAHCTTVAKINKQHRSNKTKDVCFEKFLDCVYEWEPNVYCKSKPDYFSFTYMVCKGSEYREVRCECIKTKSVKLGGRRKEHSRSNQKGSLEYLLKHGPSFQVLVTEEHVLPPEKGVGVVALEFIPAGSFVMEYGGEKITTREATKREKMYKEAQLQSIYLYDLTETWIMLPGGHRWQCSKLKTIDATMIGNFARFINHSCVPTLKSVEVGVREGHSKVVFYAIRDIEIGEELTIDYDPDFQMDKYLDVDHSKRKKCLCGMKELCRGWTF